MGRWADLTLALGCAQTCVCSSRIPTPHLCVDCVLTTCKEAEHGADEKGCWEAGDHMWVLRCLEGRWSQTPSGAPFPVRVQDPHFSVPRLPARDVMCSLENLRST